MGGHNFRGRQYRRRPIVRLGHPTTPVSGQRILDKDRRRSDSGTGENIHIGVADQPTPADRPPTKTTGSLHQHPRSGLPATAWSREGLVDGIRVVVAVNRGVKSDPSCRVERNHRIVNSAQIVKACCALRGCRLVGHDRQHGTDSTKPANSLHRLRGNDDLCSAVWGLESPATGVKNQLVQDAIAVEEYKGGFARGHHFLYRDPAPIDSQVPGRWASAG